MFLIILRTVCRIIVKIIARVEIEGYENVPTEGAAIAVSNHIGRLDAMLGVILSDRTDFVLFVADKYATSAVWRWVVRNLDAIWLNREEMDLKAMRAVQKRLGEGQILMIAPEGTRSASGTMIPAKPGAAYLATKSNLPILPIGITGTEDAIVKARLKRFQRLDIHIRVGEPFLLPKLDRKRRDEQLAEFTDEIMCQIGMLVPETHHGVYADHPRLAELQAATVS